MINDLIINNNKRDYTFILINVYIFQLFSITSIKDGKNIRNHTDNIIVKVKLSTKNRRFGLFVYPTFPPTISNVGFKQFGNIQIRTESTAST